jgi:5'-nucleotidase
VDEVIISNPALFEKKKELFRKTGISNLQVVSDFDRTLTKAFISGKKSNTSFAQIREGNYLSNEYRAKADLLFSKYRPIEINTLISREEKVRLMNEWWTLHMDLFVEYGLENNVIEDIVSSGKVIGRKELDEFLSFLDANDVPLLIISSGVGNLVEEFFKQRGYSEDDIFIASNMVEFDEKGKAIGYNENIITPFTKNELSIRNLSFFERLKDKELVLLLGDVLEDIDMISGVEYVESIKIGFLNERLDELLIKNGSNSELFLSELENYKKVFDVVILNDGSLKFVNDLLKELFD